MKDVYAFPMCERYIVDRKLMSYEEIVKEVRKGEGMNKTFDCDECPGCHNSVEWQHEVTDKCDYGLYPFTVRWLFWYCPKCGFIQDLGWRKE